MGGKTESVPRSHDKRESRTPTWGQRGGAALQSLEEVILRPQATGPLVEAETHSLYTGTVIPMPAGSAASSKLWGIMPRILQFQGWIPPGPLHSGHPLLVLSLAWSSMLSSSLFFFFFLLSLTVYGIIQGVEVGLLFIGPPTLCPAFTHCWPPHALPSETHGINMRPFPWHMDPSASLQGVAPSNQFTSIAPNCSQHWTPHLGESQWIYIQSFLGALNFPSGSLYFLQGHRGEKRTTRGS